MGGAADQRLEARNGTAAQRAAAGRDRDTRDPRSPKRKRGMGRVQGESGKGESLKNVISDARCNLGAHLHELAHVCRLETGMEPLSSLSPGEVRGMGPDTRPPTRPGGGARWGERYRGAY